MAFGLLLTLSSLFADQLALGMPGTGFGWKQLTGTLVGLLITGGGGYLLYRFPSLDDDSDSEEPGGTNG